MKFERVTSSSLTLTVNIVDSPKVWQKRQLQNFVFFCSSFCSKNNNLQSKGRIFIMSVAFSSERRSNPTTQSVQAVRISVRLICGYCRQMMIIMALNHGGSIIYLEMDILCHCWSRLLRNWSHVKWRVN